MFWCLLWGTSTGSAAETYALVIGVNKPLKAGVEKLHYADDDAIMFHKLFSKLGRSILLTEPDEATRRVQGKLGEFDRPTRKNLMQALTLLFWRIEIARKNGKHPELYFVYSGHGDTKNKQGYLALADGRLTSTDLERLVLSQTRGVTTHVIIDACKSYYLVHERRAGGQPSKAKPGFHHPKSLAQRYPNSGFLLSTSSAASSHEWERFQAGIFSHEVRSGLVGAADIDGDGQVSYDEINAFVRVANSAIPNERFRPRIHVTAPRKDGSRPLLRTRRLHAAAIEVPPSRAGRYYMETSDGVRLADLHTGRGQTVTLRLVHDGAAYLHDMSRRREYPLRDLKPADKPILLAELSSRPPTHRPKGAAHDAFSKAFSQPFTPRTYAHALQKHPRGVVVATPTVTEQAATEPGTEGGSLLVGYQMQTGYLREASLLHGARLGYLHPLGPIALGVTADYGYSAYQTSDAFDVSLNQLVGALRLDFPFLSVQRLRLALGLSVGFGWGWQSARDTEAGPSAVPQEVSRPFFRYLGHIVAELRLWGPCGWRYPVTWVRWLSTKKMALLRP